jgi:hypothetical protein
VQVFATAEQTFYVFDTSSVPFTCYPGTPDTFPVTELGWTGGSELHYDEVKTLTTKTWTGAGCVAGFPAFPDSKSFNDGSIAETLSEPASFFEALTTIDAAPSNCASTTEATSVLPESTANISQTGTSCQITITVNGAPDTTYNVVVTLSNQVIATGEVLPGESEVIAITTDGFGVGEVVYEVEQPPVGRRRCVDSVELESLSYDIAFQPPQTRSGTCYKAEWVTRAVVDPEGSGVGVTGVTVVGTGVYRPTVTTGGGAVLLAVMNSSGGVASVRVLNPGGGLDDDDPPAVVFQTPSAGGTQATGTCVVENGQVVSVNVTAAGNYLPQIAFEPPPSGVTALATAVLNAAGGITSVNVTNAGSGYFSEPEITITPRGGVVKAAVLLVSINAETQLCGTWSGIVPETYDPLDQATWPKLSGGPRTLAPGQEIAHLRGVCDCSTCT